MQCLRIFYEACLCVCFCDCTLAHVFVILLTGVLETSDIVKRQGHGLVGTSVTTTSTPTRETTVVVEQIENVDFDSITANVDCNTVARRITTQLRTNTAFVQESASISEPLDDLAILIVDGKWLKTGTRHASTHTHILCPRGCWQKQC